eukprot:Lankesteria_metandrocarpae@DN8282_c0_g1_i1.p1
MGSTEIHERLKSHVSSFFNEDYENFAEIKSLVKTGKSRLVVNIYQFNDISSSFSARLLDDPFTFFPPCEDALFDAFKANMTGSASKDPSAVDTAAPRMAQPRLGLTGWLGSHAVTPRGLTARLVNKMVSVEGIVTRAAVVRPKLVKSTLIAEKSKRLISRLHHDALSVSRDKYQMTAQPKEDQDGNVFEIEVGLSEYKDFQRFTIQEMPELAPSGELPRSVDIIAEDDLTDVARPGDRVRVFGVYRVIASKESGRLSGLTRSFVVSNNVEQLNKNVVAPDISPLEIREIRDLAERKDTYAVLANSIAPSICGHEMTKKGLLLQLLGGTRRELDKHVSLRGDVHILLIGDPSCGKSQLLRFMMNTAPLSLSTTGRGSSGVGLTAAVTVDRDTGERRLEAGAMVLADMGLVCIDEFDKMSVEDRVAIHEVMEQQTVTIAKAGIQTSLNARCSVLAAANPLYGTFDERVDLKKQIAFPDSLLSRFDLIFVIRDSLTAEQDRKICTQVLQQLRQPPDSFMSADLHAGSSKTSGTHGVIQPSNVNEEAQADKSIWRFTQGGKPAVTVEFLQKYIYYCKTQRQMPVLSDEAGEEICNFYAELRQKFAVAQKGARGTPSIPTARCLEACIRLATAHAKLQMRDKVNKEDAHVARTLLLYTLCGELPEDEDSDDDSGEDTVTLPATKGRRVGRRPKATAKSHRKKTDTQEGDDTGRKRNRDESAETSLAAAVDAPNRSGSVDLETANSIDEPTSASTDNVVSVSTPGMSKRRRKTNTAASNEQAAEELRGKVQRGSTATKDSAKKAIAVDRLRLLAETISKVHKRSEEDSVNRDALKQQVNDLLSGGDVTFEDEEFAGGLSELQAQNKLMDVQGTIWFI